MRVFIAIILSVLMSVSADILPMVMRTISVALALVATAFLGHSSTAAQVPQPWAGYGDDQGRPPLECFFPKGAAYLPKEACPPGSPGVAQQQPPPPAINALYQRYKLRLPNLTPAKVAEIWSDRSHGRPWFQGYYSLLSAGKDNPQLIDNLRKEIPCSETNVQTRDTTFSPAAQQYQCSTHFTQGMTVLLFVNLTSAYILESAAIYQKIPFSVLLEQAEKEEQAEKGGNVESEVSTLMELHSDIMSLIDNARAPSGSYVEYSKNMEQQKFAVRFK